MLLAQLKRIVGPGNWNDQESDIQAYLTEWRGRFTGRPLIMVQPTSAQQVAAVVRACHDARVPMVPQGGNTGLCGGAIPDPSGRQVLIAMHRMNRVRSVDPVGFTMTVEAGCTLQQASEAAQEAGRWFPLNLSSGGSCQIGGVLSTNAGGINVLRYGNAREQVLGIEVVLPDGSLWNGLRSLRKNNSGYDLKQLFIGAEGTLGIITAASLRLYPEPGELETVLVALPSPDPAAEILARMRIASGDQLQAFELISGEALRLAYRHLPDCHKPWADPPNWCLLIELVAHRRDGCVADLSSLWEQGIASDVIIAKNDREREGIWRVRHSLSSVQKREGPSLKHDISLPLGRMADFLSEAERQIRALIPDARVIAFGHVGDGNIHYNVSCPTSGDDGSFLAQRETVAALVHDLAESMGGSFSAEHGIGQLKRRELLTYRGELEVGLMREIKRALDEHGLMNPGKVL